MTKILLNRRRFFVVIIVLVLVLGAAVLLRDFVRQAILQPLIDLGWLIWVEMQTVPQIVYWALFVLVALTIALRSLRGAAKGNSFGYVTRVVPHTVHTSRYHHWKVNLDALPSSPFARERVERELQTLVLQIKSDQARVDFEEYRDRQNHGLVDFSDEPAVIQALFSIDHHRRFAPQPMELPRWLAWLLRRTPAEDQTVAASLKFEEIVAWMEEQTGQTDRLPLPGAADPKPG